MQTHFKGIHIRTFLQSGDIGYITYLHAMLYQKELGYGLSFEAYVAAGLSEFFLRYTIEKDSVWICEKEGEIVGSLVLMHRENNIAQLRYFLIQPLYRGIGLGHYLLQLFMAELEKKRYTGAYLFTTNELPAAASLYHQFGFRLAEEVDSDIFDKPLKQQRYELVL